MPTTLLGIDIGTYSVKAAVVQTSYRKTSVTGLASVPLAQTGGDVKAAIRAAIELAVTKPGLQGQVTPQKPDVPDAMAVAIEGERAALRIVELPASAERQLAEVLPFELEAQVPFELDDSVFDFRVLTGSKKAEKKTEGEPAAEPAAPMLEVLAAVAKTADVRARIDLVKEAAGTEPERVEVGALPLSNLAEYTEVLKQPGPVVVIDIGLRSSDVLVFENGDARMARTVSFGVEGLPESATKLAREVRVTLSSYRASGGGKATHVFLCGGGVFSNGADAFMAGELELPVAFLPMPAIDFEDPSRANETPVYARALGLALGLAGRAPGLNLRRGPLAYERGFGWIRERIPVLAGLGAVIGVSFLFSSCVGLYATAKDLDTLHEALGIVTKDVLGEETVDADRANELLAAKAGADEDPMPHADAFDVMVRLSEDIPQSMKHDVEELDLQKGHVIVHGIVGSIPDAQSIAGSLKNERCFQDVKVTRTTQMVGTDRQKYVLELDLKCPEDVHEKKEKKSGASSSASASPEGSGEK